MNPSFHLFWDSLESKHIRAQRLSSARGRAQASTKRSAPRRHRSLLLCVRNDILGLSRHPSAHMSRRLISKTLSLVDQRLDILIPPMGILDHLMPNSSAKKSVCRYCLTGETTRFLRLQLYARLNIEISNPPFCRRFCILVSGWRL